MDWTAEQSAVLDWFAHGSGSMLVRARAGTGKTTTIIEGARRAPEPFKLLCAFNKRIERELSARISASGGGGATARTLHSAGFRLIQRIRRGTVVDHGRGKRIAADVCGSKSPRRVVNLVRDLAAKAKGMLPFAEAPSELEHLAYRYACAPSAKDSRDGYTVEWICDRAHRAMVAAAVQLDGTCDFEDMIYVPLREALVEPEYGLLVVDEAQDMSPAQLELARRMAAGRVAIVGDDRQAIYGWRGADTRALQRMKGELGAGELGMTLTHRCPRKVVELAAELVRDFRAAPEAPEGFIGQVALEEIDRHAEPGDFVLSRKNAPLMGVALGLIRAGKRARIEGKDIGRGLRLLISNLISGQGSMPSLLGALNGWEQREVERAAAGGEEAGPAVEEIRDRAATIRALAEACDDVAALFARIDDLFADTDTASGERLEHVVCSSVHRAKGLEARVVFILADTLRHNQPAPCECGHWASSHANYKHCQHCPHCDRYEEDKERALEEQNIAYVAITRTKERLIWAS